MTNLKLASLASAALTLFFFSSGFAAQSNGNKLNDAQIAYAYFALNTADVELGELASRKTTEKVFLAYADRIVKEHKALDEKLLIPVKRQNLIPAESNVSKSIKEEKDKNIKRLSLLNGRQFEKEFLNFEIAFHQKALDIVQNILLKDATNEEIKSEIRRSKIILSGHLEGAKSILSFIK